MSREAERLQEIWDDAREGLVRHDVQEAQGFLHENVDYSDIERDPAGEPVRSRTSTGRPVGEWTYEGVRAPSLSLTPDGTWRAKMQRTSNPWALTVYIEVTGDTADEALDALAARVAEKSWR